MNNNNLNIEITPNPPFNGGDPYIFVSYSFEDEYAVYSEIKRFQDMGYNVYYARKGSESSEEYANALKNCSVYLVFFTPNSAKSERINNEIHQVLENEINILPIYLVETEIDIGLEFVLVEFNAISKYKMDVEKYSAKCNESFINFGLRPNKDPTGSKLVPGVGRQPLPAYRGDGSYMFISYAHKDSNIVFPEIKRFQDMGYNVWYDEGIGAGNEWLRDVLEHLVDSDLFIVFVTNNSVASKNVQKEIKFAISKEKNIIPIYLEDFEKIDMDLQLEYELSNIQGILKTTLDEENYIFKFTEAFARFGFEAEEDLDDELFRRVELKDPKEILVGDALKNTVLYSDINSKDISGYVDDFFDNLELYDDYYNNHHYKGLLKSAIDIFLESKNSYNALTVFDMFFNIFQITSEDKFDYNDDVAGINENNIVLDFIELIKEYSNSQDKLNIQKDLLVHSVNVFILGLAIYSQNENYRYCFRNYVLNSPYKKYFKIENEFSHEEFLHRWGVASLMHDIYYPLETISAKLKNSFYRKYASLFESYQEDSEFDDFNIIFKSDPYFTDDYIHTYKRTKVMDLYKATNILIHKLSLDFPELEFNQLLTNFNSFFDFIKESEFEEHGFSSALLILNMNSYLIQKFNKNYSFFFYPIVDSASAILLHNYYHYFLQKNPFNLGPLHPADSPLAYLLILCDNILEFYKKPETISDNNSNKLSKMQIDDNNFNAVYNIKSSSYGFGFSNELSLDDVLDISSIFDGKLSVETDLDGVISSNEMFKTNTFLSNSNLNDIENLAVHIHQYYNDTVKAQYEQKLANGEVDEMTEYRYNHLTNYDDLSPDFQLANFRQANSIPKKLNMVGCDIVSMDDEREAIREFSQDDIIAMARMEHEEWCREKIANGWYYGEVKDIDNLVTPYLVPWDSLTPAIQQYDIDPIKEIPHILEKAGFKIVRNKIALLSFKIYNFIYENNEEKVLSFDEIPRDIKELNFKNTNLIIETLSKLYYNVVEMGHGEDIDSFDNNEIKYLAQNYHDEWFKLNTSLGWKYGEEYNYHLKSNPNLLIWEDLSAGYVKKLINLFKELPKLCTDVDLIIIKNSYML